MPHPTFHPSLNPILLIAVVERDPSLQLNHLISPNLPSHHPNVLAAQAALSSAPDFIFPPHLPSPHFSPPPIHSPTNTPTQLPLSSSAAYFALAHNTKSPYKSSLRPPSRTFSNLSSLNNILPSTPTILRRPSSSPSQHPSHPPSHQSSESHQHPCRSTLESANRLFRATFLSCPPHVFAITAKDGSRNYAYCRPLSSTTAILLLSSASHTSVYVSALERAALTYHNLIDQAITNLTLTNSPCVCSVFIATNINRCPHHIATNLVATLLAFFNCPAFASPNHTCQYHHNPALSTSSVSSSPFPAHPHHSADPLIDLDELSNPCLTSPASSFLKSPLAVPQPRVSLHHPSSTLDNHLTMHPDVPPTVCSVTPKLHSPDSSMERVVELADATLLLRHFSIRSLLSIIVALLEERRVCFVGPNTALVSRTVLAIDNFIRPFEWPHLISPILLAHMLPVLGAPFPYLVGILEDHFAATNQLPLEDVIFADISTGKVTIVEGPGELYRHIPRRIRGRLERRLTRAKISCTRQVLRSRPSLLSNTTSNTPSSTADLSDEAGFNNKKDKPSLMKRSRSYARFNEASPHNIWLEYETTLIIDKAMQRFFADLLEGYTNTRDSAMLTKSEEETAREGFGQTLPQMIPAPLTSRSSSRRERDSDKNQLANAFQNTQMFMQWRDLALKESLTPFRPSEIRPQRGGLSRKRSKDRDSSAKKTITEADEDNAVKNPKFKIRITSDMEDVFGTEQGARGDSGIERKRFRSKRKSSHRQGVRVQSGLEDARHDTSSPSLTSDTGVSDLSVHGVPQPIAAESDGSAGHPQIRLSGADLDIESTPRRPWFSLRLTSTTLSSAREWTTVVAAQERETDVDRYDQFSEGDDTDPFDEAEENAKLNDVSSSEHVGIGWSRMRQWSKRTNRRSARV